MVVDDVELCYVCGFGEGGICGGFVVVVLGVVGVVWYVVVDGGVGGICGGGVYYGG